MRRPLRSLAVALTASALGIAGFMTAPAQAATPKDTSSSCATSVTHSSKSSHISTAGKTTADASAATKEVYSSNGTVITTVTPPKDFNFATASNQELQAYGFRPRPTDSAGLKSWNKEHAKGSKAFTDWSSGHGFCFNKTQNVSPDYLNGSSKSALGPFTNWSGLLASKGGYNEVDAEWTEPSFTSTCAASGSSYSMWPGIGGTGSSGLIQAGTDTDTDSANDVYTWVELISPTNPFPELETNAPVSPGDTIAVYVWWDATNQSADFEFDNITQGWDGALGITSISGVPASDFYSPNTAEVISERNTDTVTKQFRQLRQPSGNVAFYDNMDINDGPAYLDSSLEQDSMIDNSGKSLSTVDDFAALPSEGFVEWDTTWHACS